MKSKSIFIVLLIFIFLNWDKIFAEDATLNIGIIMAQNSFNTDKKLPLIKNKTFSTRPAKMGEEGLLYELIRELALYEGKDIEKLPLTKENLLRFGFNKNPYFFTEFAECEDQLVGYVLYYYTFSANQGRPILYIEDLYVKLEYRGLGIASLFLKQLAKYAIQNDCCRLEWHVFSWNSSAISFYQKLGGVLKNELIQVRLENEALHKLAIDKIE